MKALTNKNIILGVSGSIAAYKAPDIVRQLQELGAQVKVVLTHGGKKFITELSLQSTSQNKVHHNLWDQEAELSMGHIELARWADAILIAPASANTIASLALGQANDLLNSVILASDAPLLIAPAMNQQMYQAHATKDNLSTLNRRNVIIIEPEYGMQACGDIGIGRLAQPLIIAKQVAMCFTTTQLTGKKVLITLGATIEAIDPVRYISNHSSGKMGMALVNACIEAGASVTCVHGKVSVPINNKASNIEAISAEQMHQTVMHNITNQDIFIACAAVGDYRIKNIANNKIKKDDNNLILELMPNKDILKDVCKLEKKPFCIGFAAETQNTLENAQKKLRNKGCDVMISNDVSDTNFGFNTDENEVIFLSQNYQEKITKNSKQKVAKKIIQIFIRECL